MRVRGLVLVVACAGLVACSGGGSSSSGTSAACTTPQPAPVGLSAAGPAILGIYNRVSTGCIIVDGHRVLNANVAIAINATYVTESHELDAPGATGKPATLPPITSDEWVKYGVATAVGHQLAELDAAARHITVQAEGERVRASGLSPADWLAGQLKHHHVFISGFDVAVDELPQLVLPPGCKQLPFGNC